MVSDVMEGKPACLVPDCDCPQSARGMCSTCYRRALRIVEAGSRTWHWFEEKGWARKPNRAGRPPTNNLDKALSKTATSE